MATRYLIRIHALAIILGIGLNATTFAQPRPTGDYGSPYQKDYSWQKGSIPHEEDQEEQDQGGYQAPPPTGAMEGPTRELGLSIGEIEIPGIRLRLPRIRFPSLSQFITPPRMHTEPGIAPMVQQVQNQISVPTGSTPDEDQAAPNGKKYPTQKAGYQRSAMTQGNPVGDAELARMRTEMEQFENRLDGKLAILASSIEKLVEERDREFEQPRPHHVSLRLAPLPIVDNVEQPAVRQSSYLTARPITQMPSVRPDLQRLRPASLESTQPVGGATSARRLPRLPALEGASPLNR